MMMERLMEYIQPGFFDLQNRYEALSSEGDPLEKLDKVINWKLFLPLINRAFDRQRKSEAGRKPYNRILMFKLLILQSLYNLSDHNVCFQAQDRLSFMRFLRIGLSEKVPDEKTLWSFREVLTQGKVIEKLFVKFDQYLADHGLAASCGSMVDATIVEVPKQRNNRADNETIKKGEIPKSFEKNENRQQQKDVDARWMKKNGETYYGYKNHVNSDVKHKLIRSYKVTSAEVHDSNCLIGLLEKERENGNDKKIWADSAYYSQAMEKQLKEMGYASRINQRNYDHPVGSDRDRENHRRSKIRKRVEHIFGFMVNSMAGKMIRGIGILRAETKIGLKNLTYNLCRYEQILRLGVA
jgi:transposase, IS5 family